MPKITGRSVAEHTAAQSRRVFDEAIRLFIQRGYENVSFGDIADEVGLARNSLYRYFDTKADILTRWFRAELSARIARSSQWLDREGEPMTIITAWMDDQLDYASRPEHALVMAMAQVEPTLASEARGELFGDHSALLTPLHDALRRAGVPEEAVDATGSLIGGMILVVARHEAVNEALDPMLRERLHMAVAAIIC